MQGTIISGNTFVDFPSDCWQVPIATGASVLSGQEQMQMHPHTDANAREIGLLVQDPGPWQMHLSCKATSAPGIQLVRCQTGPGSMSPACEAPV